MMSQITGHSYVCSTLCSGWQKINKTSKLCVTGPSCHSWLMNSPHKGPVSWWRHQMETFSALLAICAGNSPVPGEFPTQRPVTRSFDVYFDLRPNKRLSKQSRGWWFETLLCSLWRHRNDCGKCPPYQDVIMAYFLSSLVIGWLRLLKCFERRQSIDPYIVMPCMR